MSENSIPEGLKNKMSENSIPEGLKNLLNKIAKKENLTNYETIYKSITTDGANYMGSLYLIDIQNGTKSLNLFAKVSNTPEQARGMINAHLVYEREIFAYTTLASTFRALETKHSIPDEHKLNITKFYGSDLTDLEEVVVLDNLIKKDYVLHDRFKSVDWEYAKAAIDQLTKFHALSYALKFEDAQKFDEIIKSKTNLFGNQDETKRESFKTYIQDLAKVALGGLDKEYVPAVGKFLEQDLEHYWKKQFESDEYSVLAHGDFRPSNIMVKYEENAIASLVTVDYQTIFYGSPLNDLLYFLFTGTDQQFRKRHYEDYIQHYHDSLARALHRFDLHIDDVYPRSIFYAHLHSKLLYGLCLGVVLLPLVLVQAEDAPKMENILETKLKGSVLFSERFNGIVRDLVKWGALTV